MAIRWDPDFAIELAVQEVESAYWTWHCFYEDASAGGSFCSRKSNVLLREASADVIARLSDLIDLLKKVRDIHEN